jgi:succinoglycan biosynthesis protein ExoO
MMTPAPTVSVLMANYNGGPYIEQALRSALAQTVTSLEIVVVDDASTDDSVARATSVAADSGGRVRIVVQGRNGGPAAARNRAFDEARGRWLAVLDSDDHLDAERIARLIAAAEANGADIVADDLMVFYDDGSKPPHRHLGDAARGGRWISLQDYVHENTLSTGLPSLGYLKPVIRADRWRASGVRYDVRMSPHEDYDLIAHLLAAGLRYFIVPWAGYNYRRHPASISRGLKAHHIAALLVRHQEFTANLGPVPPELAAVLATQRRRLLDAAAYDAFKAAVRAGRADKALVAIARRPAAARILRFPIERSLRRLWARGSGSS